MRVAVELVDIKEVALRPPGGGAADRKVGVRRVEHAISLAASLDRVKGVAAQYTSAPPTPARCLRRWHASAMPTMTLLFTDVERSTLLVERHGAAGTEALIRHHAIVRDIAEANGGRLFERIGDAAYSVFPSASDALAAALAIHAQTRDRGLGSDRERPGADGSGYGRARGIRRPIFRPRPVPVRPNPVAAGGGETLLSDTTATAVADTLPGGHRLRDLGEQRLRGSGGHRARMGRGARRGSRRPRARRHDPPATGRRLRGGAPRPARLPGADAGDRDRGRGREWRRGSGPGLSAAAGRDPDGPGHARDGRANRHRRHP